MPVLAASTKSLGDRVEIRIRDNGTGISPEVKEKMFNPFFTTKPAGEGTGLGLSISHDIIVKQHGGSIEIDTEPGQFTEIRVPCRESSRRSLNGSNTHVARNFIRGTCCLYYVYRDCCRWCGTRPPPPTRSCRRQRKPYRPSRCRETAARRFSLPFFSCL